MRFVQIPPVYLGGSRFISSGVSKPTENLPSPATSITRVSISAIRFKKRLGGRPNFPVNILVALEIIKQKDFTDEELLEQAAFNYQIAYAIGMMRTLGEIAILHRTFYLLGAGYFNMRLNMLVKAT